MRLPPALLALLLAACGSTADRAADARRRAQYEEAIARKEIKLGMTKRMVRESWGAPQKRDRVRRGTREVDRWWYPATFVYFHDDGYVIGWDAPY